MKKLIFLGILLLGISFAQYYQVSFPAVSGNSGVIVNSLISCDVGKGDRVTVGLPPSFDKATILSMMDAYALARTETNETCLSSIEFGSEEEAIEGPSGGLQFHLFYYQILTGMEYRKNVIATGQIDQDGNLNPVGGEYEKAKTAKEKGYKYFITKPASAYDYEILKSLNSDSFKMIFVNDVAEAREFIRKDKIPEFNLSYIVAMPKEINQSSPYNSSWLAKYYVWMHKDYEQEMGKITDEQLRNEYQKAYDLCLDLESKGYQYSSANYLFLNLASMKSMNDLIDNKRADKKIIDECISEFKNYIPSYETYELYIGAASRIERANEFTISEEANISSVFYANLYEMEQSLLWCKLAKAFANDTVKNGSTDDSIIKNFLQSQLYNFSNKGENVDRARRLYIKQEYLGAYYEYAYYLSSKNENITLGEKYTTRWGNTFAAHAFYLNTTNNLFPNTTVSLANYLEVMDKLVLKTGIQNIEPSLEEPKETPKSQYDLIILSIIIVLAIIVIDYVILGRGKRNGNRYKNN